MEKGILCVGKSVIDIISFVPQYIQEDSDQRCSKQTWERGGNASNNASVLAKLGAKVEFLGTLAQDHLLQFFQSDMQSYGIAYNNCPIFPERQSPASVVISSEATGSRTIVHHNGNLPELSSQYFKNSIDLTNYSWIHFEGRNVDELLTILQYLQQYNETNSLKLESNSAHEVTQSEPNYKSARLPVSLEVEKTRPFGPLLKYADVVFVGKEFAEFNGAKNYIDAALYACKLTKKGTLIICPWGEQGASFCISDDEPEIKTVHSYPPEKIVDSLGAGDTFDAAVIYALSHGLDPESSVRFGCKVAGAKIGTFGFKSVREIVLNMPEFLQIQNCAKHDKPM